MYDYQRITNSESYGGARSVLTGVVKGVSSGKYAVDITTLPDAVNGCIPAGTPILMDDAAKTVKIHYAFDLYEAVTYIQGATSMTLKLTKGFEGSRIRVGMIIGLALPDVATEIPIPLTVTAVTRTNAAYDSVSCSCSATAGGATVPIHSTFVEVADAGAGAFFVAVLPNAFTFYDVVKLPDAVEVYIDGLFMQADGVLLTRRVPPITAGVRVYLGNEGNVYMRYSASQE